jgi:hypothetical protein
VTIDTEEKFMTDLHPIRLEATLHETIWGGDRLQSKGWKFLPLEEAALGKYRIEGTGRLLLSYVPAPHDEAWQLWEAKNREISSPSLASKSKEPLP